MQNPKTKNSIMKKQEKSFQQLVNEVIEQARFEAGRKNNASPSEKRIDTKANIVDEWRLPTPNQHEQFHMNK
jgi:hypothetical protein